MSELGELSHYRPEEGGLADRVMTLDRSRSILFREAQAYALHPDTEASKRLVQYITFMANDFSEVVNCVLEQEYPPRDRTNILRGLLTFEEVKRAETLNKTIGQAICIPLVFKPDTDDEEHNFEGEPAAYDDDIVWQEHCDVCFTNNIAFDFNLFFRQYDEDKEKGGQASLENKIPNSGLAERAKNAATIAAGVAIGIIIAKQFERK